MAPSGYGFGKTVDRPFVDVVADVRAALGEQGFGIITEIDVRQTMKDKLDRDTRPYVILGACNPRFAAEVLESEPELGLFLPCNVLVFEARGGTRVSAVDPSALLQMAGDTGLASIADQVRERLAAAIEAV